MKNYFLIVTASICLIVNGCKEKATNINVLENNTSKIIEHTTVENDVEITKLNDDKSIVLKSEAKGKEFVVRKEVIGQFMVDQNYSEQLKIVYGDCSLNLPKTNGQAKIDIFSKTLNHGDWDKDGKIDWEFIYRINEDGLDYMINYVIITDCQESIVENVFYEDEDTFVEEYEEEVSHIENIKNAKDYYVRNFVFQIDKNSEFNDILKSHSKESFKKFVENIDFITSKVDQKRQSDLFKETSFWQGTYNFNLEGLEHMGESHDISYSFIIEDNSKIISQVDDEPKQELACTIFKTTKDTLIIQTKGVNQNEYKLYRDSKGDYYIGGDAIYVLNPPNESYLLTKEK